MKKILRIPQKIIFALSVITVLQVCSFFAFSQGYSVTSFSQEWCSVSTFPTSFVPVSTFSINESQNDGFRKNQTNATLILNLTAGFEFNTSVGTVTFPAGRDIASLTVSSFTTNSITLTITIPNAGGDNAFDTIYFNNFEVRAAASALGDFIRNGGTFLINNSTANPTPSQPLGILSSDQQQMIYVSSQAINKDTSDILLNCGTDKQILEIAVTVSGSCGALVVTQFDFNTNGDVGYSQNPLTNISDAKIFYTGTSQMTSGQVFSPADFFGSLGSSPSGAFIINGNRKLTGTTGTHYFYLTYDVPPTANAGDKLDASITSFVLDGITQTPSPSNPTGTRTISATQCFTPDLPAPPANLQTVTAGSLVIPMDNTNQSLNAPFNLKAYGLVHKLLLNDIPVKWVIKSGKAKDDIDFSASCERIYPSFLAAAMIDYRASAFIIDSIYVNQSFNSFGTTAAQLITSFGNNVAVFRLVNDEIVDVRYTLDQRPKLAVFNNGGNQPIHMKMLDTAGVTNYVAISAGVFEGLPACYTFCSEPHWAATISDSAVTQKVWDFVYSGGNFFAQCRGVEAYENNERFHTDNNIGILNTTVTNAYYNPDLAFMQYEGILVSNQGGSERNWVRAVGSNWRNGFYHSISHSANADTIVASGAHLVNPEQRGGNVFYLGGHDYFAGGAADWTNIQQLNAARMYLNATLVPASRPTAFTLDLGGNQSTCQGIGIPLGGNPTGPSGATYTWTPPSGLDNPNSPNPIATPPATTTYTVFADNNGCPGFGTVTITIDSAPQSDAGTDQTVCANNATVNLNGSVIYATSGVWSSSGTGIFSPDDSLLNTTYIPGNADTAAGFITLTLSSTGNPSNCASNIDSVQITFSPAPSVFAGMDTTVCSTIPDVNLNGIVSIATGGIWSSSGTGTFSDSASLNTNYMLSSADTAAGNIEIILTSAGNGNCNAVSDTVNIIIAPDITSVNAGNDTTICNNSTGVSLSGQVFGATGGTWGTSGSGTFSPSADSLNAQYIPGSSDTVAGNVSLILTTTGTSGCITKTDTLQINFFPSVFVTAGNDTAICSSDSSLAISGNVTQASGGVWSTSGNGTFSPNDSSLNATYFPGTDDYLTGTSTLTLTTYGGCTSFSDNLILSIVPFANAGADQNICANDTGAALSGITSGGASVLWTTSGTGSFSPSDTVLNPTYIITSADSAAGSIELVLSVSGATFGCANASDSVTLIILPLPIVSAGNDTAICGSDSSLAVSGSVQQVSGGVWSTSGNGTFSPNDSALNATYMVGTSDFLSGTATLTLTSNGGCVTISDDLVLSIVPFANAGADQFLCTSDTSAALSGNATGGASFIWTTSGTGSFTPSDTMLSATYLITSADSANGSVDLALSVSGANFGCPNTSDTVTIYILPPPVVNAGTNQTVCENNINVPLSGNIIGALGGVWSSNGDGNFIPDSTDLSATYSPGNNDILNGNFTITLTTTGSCVVISDVMDVNITPSPTANAGTDVSVCSTNPNVNLNGSVTIAAGGVWSSSGTGIFSPDSVAPNATYIPGNADTAAGNVEIIFTTTGNGNCLAVSDTMNIIITPDLITADAGNDTSVCSAQINLNGIVSVATGGIWTSSGNGNFSPSDSVLNTDYIFSNADTTAGTVSLILTTTGNGNCLAKSDTIVVGIIDVLSINTSAADSFCANGGAIPLSANVSTGAGTWTTSGDGIFSPDNNTLNASYLPGSGDTAAGNVILVLTSSNNGSCNALSDTLNITLIPAPNADFNAADGCNFQQIFFTDNTTGNISSWNWDFGDGTSDISQNTSHIYSAEGSYSVTLTVVSFNGCIDSTTKTVTVHPLPIPDFSVTGQCFIDSVYFYDWSGISSGNIVSWSWNFGDGTSASSVPNPAHIYSSAGTYTVTLTVTSNFGCSDSLINIFSIQPNPVADFWNTTGCANQTTFFFDSTSISSGNIVSYIWDFGDGNSSALQNPTHFYLNDTVYNVQLIAVSDSGCSDTIVQQVIVFNTPNAAFSSTAQCFVDSVLFTDNSIISIGNIVSYNWNFGDGNNSILQSPSHFYDSAGIYNVTFIVISDNGCTDTVSQSLTVNPAPVAAFGSNAVCLNDTTLFSDSSTISSGNIDSWIWNFGDGSSASLSNPSHFYSTADTFNVELIVVSDSVCSDTITQQVIVNPLPNAGFAGGALCFVDSVFFTDTSSITSGNIAQWLWDFGDGTTSTLQNPPHFYALGNYTVTLIVTSSFGCKDTVTQSLAAAPAPIASFIMSTNTVCINQQILFASNSTIPLPSTIVSTNWDFGDGNSSTSPTVFHSYAASDTFNIVLTVTSNSGCTDDTSLQVVAYPSPVANFNADKFCINEPVEFKDSSFAAPDTVVSWQWYFGDGGVGFSENPMHNYSLIGDYEVSLIVTTNHGCKDTIKELATINPAPTAGFEPDKPVAFTGDAFNFTNNTSGGISWNWDFGDSSGTSTTQNPNYIYDNGGTFIITLIAENIFGCNDTATDSVVVNVPPQVPNGFSPNGDGKNDLLFPLGGPYKEVEFKIYNNWGELIFVSRNSNDGWDGTKNGIKQPMGVYVYMLHAITEDGNEYNLHGDVTLLR